MSSIGNGSATTSLSRKKKKRLRDAARRKAKADAITQKHISTHKFMTIESLAPDYDEASSFMRKRLKKQKKRMEAENQRTMEMFKARRDTGQTFETSAQIREASMKQFSDPDPKGKRKESKYIRALLADRNSEPVVKRLWNLENFPSASSSSISATSWDDQLKIFKRRIRNFVLNKEAKGEIVKNCSQKEGNVSQQDITRRVCLDNQPPSMKLKLLRKSLGIIVKDGPGFRCPPPISSFTDERLPVHFRVYFLSGRNRARFKKPSPIQQQCWPAALCGYDLLGISPTGSGKTLGFLLPMVPHIHAQRFPRAAEGPVALIITPTRELAAQISQICDGLRKKFAVRTLCIQGGYGSKVDQVDALLNEPWHIVVSTPGRAVELMSLQILQLGRVSFLVLDEADQLLSMGFETQMNNIAEEIHPDAQRMLFSATFPQRLRSAAARWTSDSVVTVRIRPVTVSSSRKENDQQRSNDTALTGPGAKLTITVSPTVVQVVRIMHASERLSQLLRLVAELRTMERENHQRHPGPMLVFCNTIDIVKDVVNKLAHAGVKCVPLHGRMQQRNRTLALSDFRSGKARCLVATEVASRGLDIKKLSYVVNFDFPKSIAQYVQRVGRTGHQGQKGWAYSFLTEDHAPSASLIADFLYMTGQKVDFALKLFVKALDESQLITDIQSKRSELGEQNAHQNETVLSSTLSVVSSGPCSPGTASTDEKPVKHRLAKVDKRSKASKARCGELESLDNRTQNLDAIRQLITKTVKSAAEQDIKKNAVELKNSKESMIERAIDAARDDMHGLVVEQVSAAEMPRMLQLASKLSYAERVMNIYLHYNPSKLLPKSQNGKSTDQTLQAPTLSPGKRETSFVKSLLKKCEGKEDKLIAKLVKLYGPEPVLH